MNPNHVKGGFKDLKGRVKEDVGHAVGDEKLAGEGVIDQVKGKIEGAVGDMKDAVKRGVDKVLNRDGKEVA